MIKLINPLSAVGGGPWRTLADCPALRHNTAHAARGYKQRPKCICPRAVAALKADRSGYESRRTALKKDPGKSIPRRSPSPLPGGGPWRILADCPALLHNSVRGVARGPQHLRCICPRGQVVLKLQRQRRSEYQELTTEIGSGNVSMSPYSPNRVKPLWFIGNGPWLLVAECPAHVHNTLAAARGTRVPGGLRCVCPRAAALKSEYDDKQRGRKKLKNMGIVPEDGRHQNGKRGRVAMAPRWEPEKAIMQAQYFSNTLGAVIPSMPRAACKTDLGIKLSDAAAEGRSGAEPAMKTLCAGCPERMICARWVLTDERHAGEWGGVYAGMNVDDRRKVRAEMSARQPAPESEAS